MKNQLIHQGILQAANIRFYMADEEIHVVESGVDKLWNDISVFSLTLLRFILDNDPQATEALNSIFFKSEADRLKKFVECRFIVSDISNFNMLLNNSKSVCICMQKGRCPHEGKICYPSGKYFGALSKREYEIASLIAEGYQDKEIAASLFLGVLTINSYVKNIISKLNCRNRTGIAVYLTSKKLLA